MATCVHSVVFGSKEGTWLNRTFLGYFFDVGPTWLRGKEAPRALRPLSVAFRLLSQTGGRKQIKNREENNVMREWGARFKGAKIRTPKKSQGRDFGHIS